MRIEILSVKQHPEYSFCHVVEYSAENDDTVSYISTIDTPTAAMLVEFGLLQPSAFRSLCELLNSGQHEEASGWVGKTFEDEG